MAKLTKKELKEQRRLENQKKQVSQKRNEMLKKFGIWGGAIAILATSVWGLILLSNSTPSSSSDQAATAPAISSDDIIIGTPSAKVSLVEYSDFQCPACAAYHPIVNQLLIELEGDVTFAYRFFPLSQTHKNAMISSQAGYAAHLQDKFEDMYNLLFENQNDWANENNPEEIFTGYAKTIGLDIEKFKMDMNSDEAKNAVQEDYQEGVSIGVNSTPTFFLNNKKITNPGTYDDFKKLIQDEINKK